MIGTLFLNRYKPIRILGEGGMGQVYLARDISGRGEVVLKMIRPELVSDVRFRQTLKREVDLLSRFKHPHAVALIDAVVDDSDSPCLVMEYIAGQSVESLILDFGRFEPERTGRILGQLCLVLHAAHGAGILHRDLSAANLMIENPGRMAEKLKVLDFGLAQIQDGGFFIPLEKLTGASTNIGSGTPDYMCPEQIRKEPVDHRGDIYSVGVVLFAMLTGRLPFADCTEVDDILWSQVQRRPPSFAECGIRTVPPEVEAVVQSCLAKNPNDRPSDARELAKRFSEAIGDPIVDERDFTDAPPMMLAPSKQAYNSSDVLARVEAFMPEAIAVIKLRGFVNDVGGEIVESSPGLIRFAFAQVDNRRDANQDGFLSFLGFGKKTATAAALPTVNVELHIEKPNGSNKLGIAIVTPNRQQTGISSDYGIGEQICRELRAFLMTV